MYPDRKPIKHEFGVLKRFFCRKFDFRGKALDVGGLEVDPV
jgi:hypothetical protein